MSPKQHYSDFQIFQFLLVYIYLDPFHLSPSHTSSTTPLLPLENWQFNDKLNFPLFSAVILCLKNYPLNLTKYEINKTSKIPLFQLFSELERIWVIFGLYWVILDIKSNFSSFSWTGKNWEIQLEQHSNILKSLC